MGVSEGLLDLGASPAKIAEPVIRASRHIGFALGKDLKGHIPVSDELPHAVGNLKFQAFADNGLRPLVIRRFALGQLNHRAATRADDIVNSRVSQQIRP